MVKSVRAYFCRRCFALLRCDYQSRATVADCSAEHHLGSPFGIIALQIDVLNEQHAQPSGSGNGRHRAGHHCVHGRGDVLRQTRLQHRGRPVIGQADSIARTREPRRVQRHEALQFRQVRSVIMSGARIAAKKELKAGSDESRV